MRKTQIHQFRPLIGRPGPSEGLGIGKVCPGIACVMRRSRQRRYDLAMAVTRIPALHMSYSLAYELLVKEQQVFLQGLQWLSWRCSGRNLCLKPAQNLPGKRLTRRRVAATRLGPTTGSQNGYTNMRYHSVELSALRGSPATP